MSPLDESFIGNRFVAASWDNSADAEVLNRLRTSSRGWTIAEGQTWRLATERCVAFGSSDDIAIALGRSSAFDRGRARMRLPTDLAASIAREGQAALSTMAPPFRAVWAQCSVGTLTAETDTFGLGQVFLAAGPGIALAASSATLLADILSAELSIEHLAAYAHFGSFIGNETPFKGVSKLSASHSATLQEGRLTVSARPAIRPGDHSILSSFKDAMAAMLAAAPEAELELSGGLDSRIILAAMSPSERRQRATITIGVAGEPSEDVDVARSIAGDVGLNWTLLDAGGREREDPVALGSLLLNAAAAYDHMANPLDKAALILASRGRRVDTRFGGQNGEILRGFYYPAQPLEATPSEGLARRLITMRLQANDQVDGSLLANAVRTDLRRTAEDRMARLILSFDGAWGQVLDQFYLYQRMQNWVGNASGHRLMDHAPLYPFLDPGFVASALALPCGQKLNSRAAYELLCDLDMALARRPLAGGIVPSKAVKSGRIADIAATGKRGLDRIGRMLKRRGRATLGSMTIAEQWRQLELYKALPEDRLLKTGLFDEAGLSGICSGQRLPSRPTLGFLLLMTSLLVRS